MSPNVVKFFLSKKKIEDFFQKIIEIATNNSKKWKENNHCITPTQPMDYHDSKGVHNS